MANTRAQFPDGAADVARRFGVTIKTLRLYEEMGLLTPHRTATGWRHYRQQDAERLHVVLALRQLGLPLARIAALAKGRAPDLAATLDMQEQALKAQAGEIEAALSLIRRARARVGAGQALTVEDLADLVTRPRAGRLVWTPELFALATRVFTDAQRQRLSAHGRTAATAPKFDADWAQIYAELGQMAGHADPASPAALALARRAARLISEMTGGDPQLWEATRQFWIEGFADPAVSGQLPINRAEWDFLGASMAVLRDGPDSPIPSSNEETS